MSLTVIPLPAFGAEDVVVATSGPDEGAAFTGTGDGSVWRVSHDGARVDRVAHTGGRPLGLEWLPEGRLLVCDCVRGVLRVDPRTGAVEEVAATVDGQPMVFCNNAAVASDGTVWLSDSSTRHGLDRWREEFIQVTRTGRLLRLDPGDRPCTVLDGLAFANGVALGAHGSFVAVAETSARTVVRLWLEGPRAGERDHLAVDLPGYPDNIARGSDGLIWVTLASPRDRLLEGLLRAPLWLRRQVTRIPERVQPAPRRTVRVQAYDDRGALVRDLDLVSPDFHMVTGVREHDGRVWMSSLEEPAIAVHEG